MSVFTLSGPESHQVASLSSPAPLQFAPSQPPVTPPPVSPQQTINQLDPNFFVVRPPPPTPVGLPLNFRNPLQPRPVPSRPPPIFSRPSKPPRPFSSQLKDELKPFKAPHPTPDTSFSAIKTQFFQPSKPPMFFPSPHSKAPSRPTVVTKIRPSEFAVRPTVDQVTFLPNIIWTGTRPPISTLMIKPTITPTTFPSTHTHTRNVSKPAQSRPKFKPSPKIPINSLIPIKGKIRAEFVASIDICYLTFSEQLAL